MNIEFNIDKHAVLDYYENGRANRITLLPTSECYGGYSDNFKASYMRFVNMDMYMYKSVYQNSSISFYKSEFEQCDIRLTSPTVFQYSVIQNSKVEINENFMYSGSVDFHNTMVYFGVSDVRNIYAINDTPVSYDLSFSECSIHYIPVTGFGTSNKGKIVVSGGTLYMDDRVKTVYKNEIGDVADFWTSIQFSGSHINIDGLYIRLTPTHINTILKYIESNQFNTEDGLSVKIFDLVVAALSATEL